MRHEFRSEGYGDHMELRLQRGRAEQYWPTFRAHSVAGAGPVSFRLVEDEQRPR